MHLDTTLTAEWRPAANVEPRRDGLQPTILLLHYTGMMSAESAIQWLCASESRVSCHYLIEEDGRITQMVREEMRAWHAGVAFWHGERDINSASIGIEIANMGHDGGLPDFPEPQMRALETLSLDIIARWNIASHRVLAHSDVAPRRKADPGEHFDWRRLAAAGIGHWVEPAPVTGGAALERGDSGDEVLVLQRQLASYGYEIEPSSAYCEQTEYVVAAFQRHFRPALVDGRADRSTRSTLERLIVALPEEAGC